MAQTTSDTSFGPVFLPAAFHSLSHTSYFRTYIGLKSLVSIIKTQKRKEKHTNGPNDIRRVVQAHIHRRRLHIYPCR